MASNQFPCFAMCQSIDQHRQLKRSMHLQEHVPQLAPAISNLTDHVERMTYQLSRAWHKDSMHHISSQVKTSG